MELVEKSNSRTQKSLSNLFTGFNTNIPLMYVNNNIVSFSKSSIVEQPVAFIKFSVLLIKVKKTILPK